MSTRATQLVPFPFCPPLMTTVTLASLPIITLPVNPISAIIYIVYNVVHGGYWILTTIIFIAGCNVWSSNLIFCQYYLLDIPTTVSNARWLRHCSGQHIISSWYLQCPSASIASNNAPSWCLCPNVKFLASSCFCCSSVWCWEEISQLWNSWTVPSALG